MAVDAHKALARIERTSRNLNTARLEARPIYVYGADHVRTHVFLSALACHVEWHLHRRPVPPLFEDDGPEGVCGQLTSPVQMAAVSPGARHNATIRTTADSKAGGSQRTLLDHLASLTPSWTVLADNPDHVFSVTADPKPKQEQAVKLLGVDPAGMFPVGE